MAIIKTLLVVFLTTGLTLAGPWVRNYHSTRSLRGVEQWLMPKL